MRRPPRKYERPDGSLYAPSVPTEFFRIEKRPSVHGSGAFATEFIRRGSVVLRDGGMAIENPRLLPKRFFGYQAMVDEHVYLSPPDYDALEPTWFINHSCDPSLARYGGLIYVTKRDINPGEELTVDYSPFVACRDNWTLRCVCGASGCREVIMSRDWTNPVLARNLWTEWLPFVQQRIERLGILQQCSQR